MYAMLCYAMLSVLCYAMECFRGVVRARTRGFGFGTVLEASSSLSAEAQCLGVRSEIVSVTCGFSAVRGSAANPRGERGLRNNVILVYVAGTASGTLSEFGQDRERPIIARDAGQEGMGLCS